MSEQYLIRIESKSTKLYWHNIRRRMQRSSLVDNKVKLKICQTFEELLVSLRNLGVILGELKRRGRG